MRIVLELQAEDLARFRAALARAARLAACMDELDILETTKRTLDSLPLGRAPGFIRQRFIAVQRLIVMLEDEAWALGGPERDDVLRTLVYVCDPDDLIPDGIEGIGLLDDAIMLELLLRRHRHVFEAYADFCRFRRERATDDLLGDPLQRAKLLAGKRLALVERMRRRLRTAQSGD